VMEQETAVLESAQAATRPVETERWRPGMRLRRAFSRLMIWGLMSLIALAFIVPLVWNVSTAFKPKAHWFTKELHWIPEEFTWANYEKIFGDPATPIGRWFVNSVWVASFQTIVILALDSLAAYAYGRLEFPGRKQLYALLLSTMFLPGVLFLVPNFVTINRMGLLNEYAGVLLPGFSGVFGIFFMRQFYESIPKDLEEAALIDGASTFQVFTRVVLPLSKPALATLGIILFLGSWNDFLWPLLVLKDRTMQTLQPGLRTLQGAYTMEYGAMLAGAMIVATPVLILYVFLQRFIVQSVTVTGLKG
jgi:multiple sugar transport system permease protein